MKNGEIRKWFFSYSGIFTLLKSSITYNKVYLHQFTVAKKIQLIDLADLANAKIPKANVNVENFKLTPFTRFVYVHF